MYVCVSVCVCLGIEKKGVATTIGPCNFNYMQCWSHLLILWDAIL